MTKEKIKVKNLSSSQRIDLYLVSSKPELTRNTSKKIIMEGAVTLNREKVRPNQKVVNGDIIEVNEELVSKLINKHNLTSLSATKMNLDIVYEDLFLIALNKKAGIVVHPVYGYKDNTLMNGLVYYMLQNKQDGDLSRIRPLHRLDKDTSGIILFSKDKAAHEFYSSQFENHSIEKVYHTVVKGDFKEYLEEKTKNEYFNISSYIGRSNIDSKLYRNTSKEKGLPARTKVYFERYWEHPKKKDIKFSLLKVLPETGRTHQIRVHLAGIGFPIMGDTFYGKFNFERLMLHASSITIKKYDGEKNQRSLTLEAKLPKEFGK